jgi:hypothetical protein
MTPRHIIILALLAILLAIILSRALPADADLGGTYPPDADGVIHDPQIDAFVTSIIGWSYTANCIPDPMDGAEVRTAFDEEVQPDGSLLAMPPVSMDVNGQICGALDHLLRYRAGFFHRYEVEIVSVVVRPVKRPKRGSRPSAASGRQHASRRVRPLAGRPVQILHQNDCSWKATTFTACREAAQRDVIWGENRVQMAAGALFVVTHDAWHARLFGQAPRVDDGHLAAFDEGVTECDAVRDLPRVIGLLHLPPWLARMVLSEARARHFASQPEYLTVC